MRWKSLKSHNDSVWFLFGWQFLRFYHFVSAQITNLTAKTMRNRNAVAHHLNVNHLFANWMRNAISRYRSIAVHRTSGSADEMHCIFSKNPNIRWNLFHSVAGGWRWQNCDGECLYCCLRWRMSEWVGVVIFAIKLKRAKNTPTQTQPWSRCLHLAKASYTYMSIH